MARPLILGLLLAACGGQTQNTEGMPSTDEIWEARQGQSIIFLDRNGNVILREGAEQFRFELLDGDRYCEGLTPQTTCIELSTSAQSEAQARVEHYGSQLEQQGWQPALVNNQYTRDIGNGCRAIVIIGAPIAPDGSTDFSRLALIQNSICDEGEG